MRSPFSRYERSRWAERLAMWCAWRLPRPVAYWAFIRVATRDLDGHPDDRPASESLKAWASHAS